MTIQVGSPATIGEKELKEDWPITEGITAGTTKQKSESPSLEPVNDLTFASGNFM